MMLTYELDIEKGSLWLRNTPTELALKQSFYCTEAGIFYAKENFHTSRDFKNSYILFYTIEGAGIIRQNDTTIHLLPGQALFMNCRTPQSYQTDPTVGKWVHYWMHIDGNGIDGFKALLSDNNKLIAMNASQLSLYFDTILKNLESHSTSTILRISQTIHSVLTELVIQNTMNYSQNQIIIMKTADYIAQHYQNNIPLSNLLEIANMSKSYYLRLFRQYIGTTPHNYLLSLRITKAKEYLEISDMTIHEIACTLGFTDDAAFSNCFHTTVGLSPFQYRKTAITKQQISK